MESNKTTVIKFRVTDGSVTVWRETVENFGTKVLDSDVTDLAEYRKTLEAYFQEPVEEA